MPTILLKVSSVVFAYTNAEQKKKKILHNLFTLANRKRAPCTFHVIHRPSIVVTLTLNKFVLNDFTQNFSRFIVLDSYKSSKIEFYVCFCKSDLRKFIIPMFCYKKITKY